MEKTITLEMHRVYPEAKPVSRLPFRPTYLMGYASEQPLCWQHLQFSAVLQQHDAFNVYIVLLEVRVPVPSANHLSLKLPLTLHRSDLHWLYQLRGSSVFHYEMNASERIAGLSARSYRQLYSVQRWAALEVFPDEAGRYVLADVVVKNRWLNRYHPQIANRSSKNHPLVPPVAGCLRVLFTLPPKTGIEMDAALSGPVAALVNKYRTPSPFGDQSPPWHASQQLIEAVLEVVEKQVAEGLWPYPLELADTFDVHVRKLQRVFISITGYTLQAYIGKVRMREAWRRLTEEKQEPASVAFGLGYREQASFNHQFKKHFGIPPGEARGAIPRFP